MILERPWLYQQWEQSSFATGRYFWLDYQEALLFHFRVSIHSAGRQKVIRYKSL